MKLKLLTWLLGALRGGSRAMKHATVAVLASTLALTAFAHAQPQTDKRLKVEAFIVSDRPLVMRDIAASCCSITVHRLDTFQALSDELSRGLPSNPVLAEQIVQRVFHERKADIQSTAEVHAKVIQKAISYGLTRYPALVFNDGESVIYGVTDLKTALSIYRRAQQ